MNGVVWYSARAGGILAYLLLSASVVVGLLLSRKKSPPWPKFAVEDVHRFLTILTGVFVGIHVGALLVDTYTPFSLGDVLIPFASGYRRFATALGVVALELLLAVALTNAVRGRIPRRLWRRAHYLTFGVWGAATVHGVLAGTDRIEPWFVFLYTAALASVGFAATARLPARA